MAAAAALSAIVVEPPQSPLKALSSVFNTSPLKLEPPIVVDGQQPSQAQTEAKSNLSKMIEPAVGEPVDADSCEEAGDGTSGKRRGRGTGKKKRN